MIIRMKLTTQTKHKLSEIDINTKLEKNEQNV